MNRPCLPLVLVILFGSAPVMAHVPDHAVCGDPAHPLLSVSDFNGSGTVDGRDMVMLARAVSEGTYYAFYDRNADGALDVQDLQAARADLNKESTAFDRELAVAFARFKDLQTVSSPTDLTTLGFIPATQPLQGHGVHWVTPAGLAATQGFKPANKRKAEGINVPSTADSVWAMFWGHPAQPLFEDPASESGLGPLDYPTPGGVWQTKQVQAFATMPPTFFSSPDENWHPHAGLCAVVEDFGQGEEIVLHQHMTFAQCQALPSLRKTGIVSRNAWMNFWMLHLWLFNLNPYGVFGGTHPCLDPQAPPEETINGDRTVPPFFHMMH